MIGLTFVFHVFSAICIISLIYWVIHLQGQVKFNQSMLSEASGKQRKLVLDWPSKFFKKFSRAIGVSFESQASRENPVRINVGPWLKLHVDYSILSMRLAKDSQLLISLARSPSDGPSLIRSLEESTSGKISIKFNVLEEQ